MCWQCVTNTEALVLSGVGVTSAVQVGTRQVAYSLGLVSAEARNERDANIYRENVAFMESLGLDREVVLGPQPKPVTAPARVVRERVRFAPLRALRSATARFAAGAGTTAFWI